MINCLSSRIHIIHQQHTFVFDFLTLFDNIASVTSIFSPRTLYLNIKITPFVYHTKKEKDHSLLLLNSIISKYLAFGKRIAKVFLSVYNSLSGKRKGRDRFRLASQKYFCSMINCLSSRIHIIHQQHTFVFDFLTLFDNKWLRSC